MSFFWGVDGLNSKSLSEFSGDIHSSQPLTTFFYAHSKRFSLDVPASPLAILLIFRRIFVLLEVLEAMRNRVSFVRNLT